MGGHRKIGGVYKHLLGAKVATLKWFNSCSVDCVVVIVFDFMDSLENSLAGHRRTQTIIIRRWLTHYLLWLLHFAKSLLLISQSKNYFMGVHKFWKKRLFKGGN